MATEKRLIDANELLRIYKKWIPQLALPEDEGDKRGVETCIAVLEDAPTVDAVEVVRCKDCKYKDEKIHACTNVKFRGEKIHIWVEPDDFCSYGERKDNG